VIGPPSTRRSLAPYFPLPLVGAAVLLAILIVLTPNLLSTSSPAAGSLISQPELLVDRAPTGGTTTQLYLRGLGIVRYAALDLSWAPLNSTTVPVTPDGVRWTDAVAGNASLGVDGSTTDGAFLVNATATFVDSSGAGATYTGTFAFVWSEEVLYTTAYQPATGSGTTGLSQLPLVLLLVQGPYGGQP
jgi:hypothetical protein